MAKDYEIGYGKPPKHMQFPKGRSGNPKGRPKGHRNFRTDLLATLNAPVQLKEKGRSKKVSTQKAALLRLREKALAGEARALDRLIDLARVHNDEEISEATAAALVPSDSAILDNFAARLQRRDTKVTETREDALSDNTENPEEDDDAWLR